MRSPPRLLARRLRRDRVGLAAVEFGLLAPLLALLLTGTVDVALAVAAKLRAQQAATRAIEKISVAGSSGTALASIKAEAAAAAGVPLGNVTIDNWLECDGVRQPSFSGNCTSGSQIGRHASLVVTAGYSPIFDFVFAALGLSQNGKVPVSGRASVRLQ